MRKNRRPKYVTLCIISIISIISIIRQVRVKVQKADSLLVTRVLHVVNDTSGVDISCSRPSAGMLQTFTIPSAPPVARLLKQKGSHSRPLTWKRIDDPFEIPQYGVCILNINVRSTCSIADGTSQNLATKGTIFKP